MQKIHLILILVDALKAGRTTGAHVIPVAQMTGRTVQNIAILGRESVNGVQRQTSRPYQNEMLHGYVDIKVNKGLQR